MVREETVRYWNQSMTMITDNFKAKSLERIKIFWQSNNRKNTGKSIFGKIIIKY